jgi:hypothetical protein
MAIVTESGTVDDGLVGSFSYTLSVNDQSGDFTGSFTFSNYHGSGSTTVSGPVNVSGTYNIGAGVIDHIYFSMPSLLITDGVSSVTASGSVDLLNGNPSTATVNLYLANNLTGKTAWIDHYTQNVTEGAGYVDVTESGKIYLHDYGYVVVSTATPFRYMVGSATPSSGVLVITGSSNGRVRLTALDAASYSVDVDANGDGAYEVSIPHTWI